MQTKVMIALFGLFAEVERDLISERTKEGVRLPVRRGQGDVDVFTPPPKERALAFPKSLGAQQKS